MQAAALQFPKQDRAESFSRSIDVRKCNDRKRDFFSVVTLKYPIEGIPETIVFR